MTDPNAPRKSESDEPRGGRCAIVGRPNVGKSTLLNVLLGQKLVVATATPGTTRSAVLGVYVREAPPTQIAFVDTPGLGRPRTALAHLLGEETKAGLLGCDVVLLMTDVQPGERRKGVHAAEDAVLDLLAEVDRPVVLAINKVDAVAKKDRLLPIMAAYQERREFAAVIPISAEHGTNLDSLVTELRGHLPEGKLYEEDVLTDRPERFFAAELVREAALKRTREEVPHGTAVVLEQYEEDGDLIRIQATVVVEKPGHKKILIGAGGQRIKEIGTEARLAIEELTGRRVVLKLWVKVVPGWTQDPNKARRLLTEGTT
jgi:GTP-binding protein Era